MSSRWTVVEVERHGALLGDRQYRCHQEFPRDAETLWSATRQSVESLPGWSVTTADPAKRRLEAAIQADAMGWLTGIPSKRQVTPWVTEAAGGRAALEGTVRLQFVGLAGRALAAGQSAAEALWTQLAQAVNLQLAGPTAPTAAWTCSTCGAAVPPDTRFCGHCGAALQD